jgi:hypothetical protein
LRSTDIRHLTVCTRYILRMLTLTYCMQRWELKKRKGLATRRVSVYVHPTELCAAPALLTICFSSQDTAREWEGRRSDFDPEPRFEQTRFMTDSCVHVHSCTFCIHSRTCTFVCGAGETITVACTGKEQTATIVKKARAPSEQKRFACKHFIDWLFLAL